MAYVDHISVDGVQYDIRDAEAVSYEQEQTLTDAQQEQARANIGAGSEADVADLKSHLNDIGVEKNIVPVSAQKTDGKTINGSGAIVDAGGNYHTYKASVAAGETYLVTASNNWSAPYFAYYDSSMVLVEKGTESSVGSTVTRIEDRQTVTPVGASFIVTVSVNEEIAVPVKNVDGYVLPRLDIVESNVSDLMDGTVRNLFNPSKVVTGYYFNGSNVLIANENSEYINEYIPINPAYKYVASTDLLQVLTYGSDKTFIERAYNLENAGYAMEFDDDVAFVRVSRYGSHFPDDFIFSTEDSYAIFKGAEGNTYSATKTATSLTVTIGKLKVVVNKYNDSSIRAVNLWRTNDASILASDGSYKRLWYNSDSDGVVKILGEDDFIGGYHGDETQTAFHLLIDGIEYAESSTFTNLEFDEIMLLCESNVYHCNTSALADTIAFKRNKIIQFNHDGYTVKNYWVAQETVTLNKAYMGMLSVERYTDNNYTDELLKGYSENHDYKFKSNITPTGGQPGMTEVIFNTIYGDVGIVIDNVKSPGTYYGNVTNYNSTYDKRLKAYLATIDSNNGISVSSGSVIKARATTFVR